MKKVLSLVLIVTIVLSLFSGLSFTSSAADLPSTGSCGDNVTYTFDSATGTLTISGSGKMRDYSYTTRSPFYSKTVIKTLVIDNGVTSIGNDVFNRCESLTSVTIGNSVKSIGDDAFYLCSGLTSITIPDSVTFIGKYAFNNCSSLTMVNISSIEAWCNISFGNESSNPLTNAHNLYINGSLVTDLFIPDSVTSIGRYTFSGCSSLTGITVSHGNPVYDSRDNCNAIIETEKNTLIAGCQNTAIPNSVTNIGNHAFSGCNELTNIIIPDSVTSIGERAFSGCSSLTSITIPDSVTSIGEYAFPGCRALTSITIPDSVTSIEEGTFGRCSSLRSVIIPDSVTNIGSFAFSGCSGLKELTMPCSAKIYNSEGTFNNCTNIEKVTLTKGTGTMQNYTTLTNATDVFYQYTPWYISRSSLRELVIEDGVKSISNNAFFGCGYLTNITISTSVTSIGSSAFDGTAYYENALNWDNDVLYINHALIAAKTTISGAYSIKEGTTCIASSAFYNCSGLTSVTIPDSVISISANAFARCSSLTSINIPNSVTSIGSNAFYGCSSLTSVTIPNSVTSINYQAFSGCSSLTSITIPDSVTSINKYTFTGCRGLTSVNIPDSVTSIGESAFYGCSGLSEITIPDSVTTIGNDAFRGCSSLTSIIVPDFVTRIGNYSFYGCESLTDIRIGSSVTSIGSYAFYECYGLTSITIPDSVTSIGDHAFYDCIGLKELTMPCSANIYNSAYTFYNCTNIEKMTLSKGEGTAQNFASFKTSATYYQYTPWYISRNNLKELIIEDGVKSIGDSAFPSCIGLSSITIPDSVTSIGWGAFQGCSALTSVSIGKNTTSIGDYAFSGCSELKELTMPCSANIYNSARTFQYCSNIEKVTLTEGSGMMQNYTTSTNATDVFYQYTPWYISRSNFKELVIEDGVDSIGSYAFYGCSRLTNITIPDSVTSIDSFAFNDTAYYENALNWDNDILYINHALIAAKTTISGAYSIKEGTTCIANAAFFGGRGLTSVTLPDSVTSIGNNAFEDCSGLINITIPNSVTSIGDSAFSGCTGLTDISIPDSVTSISNKEFFYCLSLTHITIPDSVTDIGVRAFSGCRGLTSVNIPDSVTSIGESAFYSCSGLKSVNIPDFVTSIGNDAFYGCAALTNLNIGASVTSIGNDAFYGCSQLTRVIVGDSVTNIGNYAFFGCSGLKELTMPCSAKIYNSGYTFSGCTNIEKMTLTKGTGSMQDYSTYFNEDAAETYYQYTPWFLSRAKFKEIVLEDGVEHIGAYAFYAQSNIAHILIPTSVTSIGEHAFGLCSALKDVYYPGEAQWNQMTVAADNDALIGATIHFNHIHQFENPVVTATCTEGGKKTGVCACGKIQEETVPALGHAFSEWTLTKSPTCTAEGIETRVCSRDASHKETRTVDALGHHFEADKQYCLNGCGKRNPDYVPPHVHSYTLTVTKPTCTKQGFTTHTCSCGESYIDTYTSALGHNASKKTVVKPTGTQFGYTEHSCSRCGELRKVDNYTAPTGKPAGFKCASRTATAEKFTWSKTSGVSGYQVQLLNSAGKSAGTATTTGNAYTFSKLTAGHAYKARVRFYIKAADGKNYYGAWATITSPTLPAGSAITKLTPAKKAFTAQWKKAAVTGYQLQYGTNAKFAKATTKTIKGAAKVKLAVKSLKGGAKYFVRVRTFKTIAGKNYYSAWSGAKAVTTKK